MATGNEQIVEALRASLMELERVREINRQMLTRSDEPVAIVGMSCRYPGGVSSPAGLWELVASSADAISEFPEDRGWDVARLFDPDPDSTGRSYTRHGGFIYDAGDFDAEFFGIGAREALAMDPQQRLLLEGAWEAFEDAGVDPASLVGSRTGVFAGVSSSVYGFGHASPELEGLRLTGTTTSVASGRLAYTFGLEGPAVTLDTACSSSLVALHLACQALRSGECSLALAGGVTVLVNPALFVEFSRQRGLSVDGRCKSFGADADGTGWSEGMGLLLLERLSDAERNGHRMLGLVRGSAVNQDGASNGLTAPNGPSQQRVIRDALAGVGLSTAEVDAVEAHGTGTALGDPIEAQALLATYGQDRPGGRPLWLGSVKSNMGHTLAAAGVAGVIKMVMAMRHGVLPRTLHADEPSPHVDWSEGNVALLTEEVPWAEGGRPRRAGVSSFGISGTNAHVILEEAPRVERADGAEEEQGVDGVTGPVAESGVLPFLVSASSGEALVGQAERLRSFVESQPNLDTREVGAALALRRASLSHRAVVLAEDLDDLTGLLGAIERGETVDGVVSGVAGGRGRSAFLFSGQGSQWAGMGRGLYEAFPVFANELDVLCAELDRHLGCSLKDLLFAEDGSQEALSLDQTEFTQPALFTLEVALYGLVTSFGLKSDFLIGHSIGELAAAFVAGVFSLEDACRLVAGRGRLMGALDGVGAMAAVKASEREIAESLSGFEDRLTLAAVNAPEAVVVSGDETALGEWEILLGGADAEDGERKITRLRVSNAFHSVLMDPMLEEFRRLAEGVSFSQPSIPIVSNVTGKQSDGELCDAEYWVSQVRGTVRFADGVQSLRDAGVTRFVEIGPGGVLSGMTHECVGEDDGTGDGVLVAASLRKRHPQARAFLGFLAQVHVNGVDVDWGSLFDERAAREVSLPTYAFQRRRYWLSGAGPTDASSLGQYSAEHPLLGAALHLAGEGESWLFTGRLAVEDHPWLKDHVVMGAVLMPGTGFVELALAAGQRVGLEVIEELTLQAPLLLTDTGAVLLQITVSAPDLEGRRELGIYSCPQVDSGEMSAEEEWTCHASGVLCLGEDMPGVQPRGFGEEWPPPGAREVEVESFYDRLEEAGYGYGPAFQGMGRAFSRGDEELFAEVALADELTGAAQGFCIHPALSDAALHAALLSADQGTEVGIPFSFAGVRLFGRGASALRVRLGRDAGEAGTLSLSAIDTQGEPVFSIEALHTRAVDQSLLQASQDSSHNLLYELEWVELPSPTANGSRPHVAVLGGEDGSFQARGAESYPDVTALENALEQGSRLPEVVLLAGSAGTNARAGAYETVEATVDGDVPGLTGIVHQTTRRALESLQQWIASERLLEARLVFVTDRAMAVAEDEAPNLAQAALVGLLRSAQSEHPGRFGVIDLDESEISRDAIYGALSTQEPELAIRKGVLYTRRVVRMRADDEDRSPAFDARGTVLITGGTGGLGALVARHLAVEHGAKRLLLVGRKGLQAEGATELRDALSEVGCDARVVACDVSDRDRLEELIASIPDEDPLRMVVHAAGVLDDGLVESLDGERLSRVLAPKVDGAINLHELTKTMGLREFVLFSSVAASMGSPGQSNYAAANTFLDSLAAHRRVEGLPGVSLAWGAWDQATGMTGTLSDGDRARFERIGIVPLSERQGLELFDIARGVDGPLMLPMSLQTTVLRAQAKAGVLPAILRGLVRVPTRRASDAGGSLARKLAASPEAEWDEIVSELVRWHVAGVMGQTSAATIDPRQAFKDLGLDSLAAVELRNRLGQATGLRLPSTLVFDHPTPAAVAEYVRSKVEGTEYQTRVVSRSSTRTDEPIAIVGMSCRYPGGVASPEELWKLVASGADAISEFPDDRGWGVERLFDTDPDNPGTSYTRHGGFLHDAGDFDADFFGIGPREALAMDPQQRLLLEGVWEACEDAGILPSSLAGSRTGVFTGLMYQEYGMSVGSVSAEVEGYLGTGSAGSVVSGRLAYNFGFEGPAMTIDTACSSSLVTLHLACQALRSGECSLALAGGVTVMITPAVFVVFSRQRGLSVDGRCRSFGAGADGTGWSEGMGLLLLERLSDAERNGHEVLAVVRGSAVNQDGASNGLTAPNGPSQQRVIQEALAGVGLSSAEVDVVEAHGTGTSLGDPIEAQALLATYGQGRPDGRPLWLGSIKSNMGHTQAAAGVAGVIKMVQAMRHGVLPKTLYADEPSPHVDWSEGDIALLTEEVAWERNGRPRRAGVSSFGISGTNAHVILEEAPASERDDVAESGDELGADGAVARTPVVRSGGVLPLLVSASSGSALAGQAGRLRSFVEDRPELDLRRVGGALALRRASLSHRAVALADGVEDLVASLGAVERGETGEDVVSGVVGGGRVAFLFSGQGSQWAGMGRGLHEAFPVFGTELDRLCDRFDGLLGRSLKEMLFAEDGSEGASLLDRTEFTQPALFALGVALYRLVESFGLAPDFLVGHSIGELAAAFVAGVFSLEDACRLVAGRGRLMGALDGAGAMAAVRASEREVVESLSGFEDRLALAAVNAPAAVVVSGDEVDLAEWEAEFATTKNGGSAGKVTRLRVSNAFHSVLMDPMLEEFRVLAESVEFSEPSVPIVSNVSGELAGPELGSAAYWVSQVRGTVRFADGVRCLRDLGVTRFLEIGPDGVLSGMTHECLSASEDEAGVAIAPTLRRRRAEDRAFLGFLAQAHVNGLDVDWGSFFDERLARGVALPTYAFQRRRYWLASQPNVTDASTLGQSPAEHPLLGATLHLAGGEDEWIFTGRLSTQTHPWVSDHAVMGTVLMPGTGLVELALAAGGHVGLAVVEELTLQAPLLLPEDCAVQLQVTVAELDPEGRRKIEIYSRPEKEPGIEPASDEWTHHAAGVLGAGEDASASSSHGLAGEWPPAGARELDSEYFYQRLAEGGYDYGPSFQALRRVFATESELFAEVALDEERASEALGYCLHPALSDASLHAAILASMSDDRAMAVGVPFAFSGVRLYGRGAGALRVCLYTDADDAQTLSLFAVDEQGEPVFSVGSLQARAIDQSQLSAPSAAGRDSLYEVEWVEISSPSPEISPTHVVAVGSDEELRRLGVEVESYRGVAELEGAIERGSPVPEVVLMGAPAMIATPAGGDETPARAGDDGRALAETVHGDTRSVLDLLRRWVASELLARTKLLIVTDRASAVARDEAPNLAQSALVGLIRSAQAEYPERFGLIDLGEGEAIGGLLPDALSAGEPELAVRRGALHGRRLVRLRAGAGDATGDGDSPQPFDPAGTVLITGGTGGLGALVARHLAEHGAERLLLVSRRGPEADGAQDLRVALGELGCQALIAACDVSDRARLKDLIDSIPDDHPLTAVVHAAGGFDAGSIDSLDGERLAQVLTPKVNAAINLHELTREMGLREFVLFSSVSGTLGSPRLGAYAAANAFLDALATHRRAEGLPGLSLAFGIWERATGFTDMLSDADRAGVAARVRRSEGLIALSDEQGLELFDIARAVDEPALVPVRLDMGVLRGQAKTGMLPAVLRGLVRVPVRQASDVGGSLTRKLAAAPESEWDGIVLELVAGHVAGVLGYASSEAVDPQRDFKDLGFDSLAAVELRNRLNQATGFNLQPTLVFDHPNTAAVAQLIVEGAQRTGPQDGSVRGDDSLGVFSELIVRAAEQKRLDDMVSLLMGASAFLPTFGSLDANSRPPRVRTVARGQDAPELVCIPSFANQLGPHQFLRVAGVLDGRRTVSVASLPGLEGDEPLPASLALVSDAIAAAVEQTVAGRPFVLVGYSTGGEIAHCVTEALERLGTAPVALLLLDTYLRDSAEPKRLFSAMMSHMLSESRIDAVIADRQVLAMGAYMRMLHEGVSVSIDTPSVMFEAEESLRGDMGNEVRCKADSTIQVVGDHFTIIEDHAEATARAIDAWLSQLKLPLQAHERDTSELKNGE